MFFRFVPVALGPGTVDGVHLMMSVCHGTRSEVLIPALMALEPFAYLVLASLLSEAAFSFLVVPAVE